MNGTKIQKIVHEFRLVDSDLFKVQSEVKNHKKEGKLITQLKLVGFF